MGACTDCLPFDMHTSFVPSIFSLQFIHLCSRDSFSGLENYSNWSALYGEKNTPDLIIWSALAHNAEQQIAVSAGTGHVAVVTHSSARIHCFFKLFPGIGACADVLAHVATQIVAPKPNHCSVTTLFPLSCYETFLRKYYTVIFHSGVITCN